MLKSELLMGCSLLLTDLCAEELEQMQPPGRSRPLVVVSVGANSGDVGAASCR